ncbi:MAG: helix-turn-helix domain-containing protein [Bifidobacterium psychraerophilum]|uniref:PucR family transcriptional regulator n=1 Tax=Bifidobacterium psychraerophilum TaxID=218140 RepID=UPI0039ED735D
MSRSKPTKAKERSNSGALAKVAHDAVALFNPELRRTQESEDGAGAANEQTEKGNSKRRRGKRPTSRDTHAPKSSGATPSPRGTGDAGIRHTGADANDVDSSDVDSNGVLDDAQAAADSMSLQSQPSSKPRLPEGVQRAVDKALEHLDHDLAWHKNLSAQDKELLNLIIETAVSDFLAWMKEFRKATDSSQGPRPSTDHIFFVAPLEFTKAISLKQALEVTRLIVDILERNLSGFSDPDNEQEIRNGMLYYAREVAFSAASVYATSAEARGDWDTRIETLTIEDLIDDVTDHHVTSRMSMLGWSNDYHCFAVVGKLADARELESGLVQRRIRGTIRAQGGECLLSNHDGLLVMLIDPRGKGSPEEFLEPLIRHFDQGPLCLGPLRHQVTGAAQSIRAALITYQTAPAMSGYHSSSGIPRPLRADDVLPERALFGDTSARQELYDDVYASLRGDDQDNPLIKTLSTFLLSGSSLETTARELNVHPNTVRYRLKRSIEITGWDPMNPREAYVLLTAVKIGLIEDSTR